MERKTRFELATPSLARRCSTAELLPRGAPARPAGCVCWCRGGDLNSYARKGTTPSRWRVCLFHHLGRSRGTNQRATAVAGVEGLEPPTGRFGDGCSTS